MIKQLFAAIVAASLVCFMAWLAGFNFDQRGENAFWIGFISIVLGSVAFMAAEEPTYNVRNVSKHRQPDPEN